MKLLLSLFAIGLLTACNSASTEDVQATIPGTYFRTSQHEYGKEWDTLSITLQNASANEYNLTRRWRYERVLDDKALAPEYKVSSNSATYNAGSKKLEEARTGKAYSFDAKKGVLFSGAVQYQKLK